MSMADAAGKGTEARRVRRAEVLFWGACLGLAFVLFVGAVLAGRAVLNSGRMWPENFLLGHDLARNIAVVTQAGVLERSNVHPLVGPMLRPVTAVLRAVGITEGMSAIMAVAGCGALGLLVTVWFFRERGVSRTGALAGMMLMGGTGTWIYGAALPGTSLVHTAGLAGLGILLCRALRRPGVARGVGKAREAGWIALGALVYGVTVLCAVFAPILYAFRGRGWGGWLRAAGFGLVVWGVGIALSWMAGSSLNTWVERRWITDPEFKGETVAHPVWTSASSNLVWTIVAPEVEPVQLHNGNQIYSILHWNYGPVGWLLALLAVGLVAGAAWSAMRERDTIERRINLALASCLAFQVVFHVFYYVAGEGIYIYNGHALFFVVALMGSMLRCIDGLGDRRARGVYAGLAVLAVVLAIRHGLMVWGFAELPLPS